MAPDEDSFEEQKPQNFEQFHPQPPKGNHRSDDKKPKEKIENPSAENFLDEVILLWVPISLKMSNVRGAKKIY